MVFVSVNDNNIVTPSSCFDIRITDIGKTPLIGQHQRDDASLKCFSSPSGSKPGLMSLLVCSINVAWKYYCRYKESLCKNWSTSGKFGFVDVMMPGKVFSSAFRSLAPHCCFVSMIAVKSSIGLNCHVKKALNFIQKCFDRCLDVFCLLYQRQSAGGGRFFS